MNEVAWLRWLSGVFLNVPTACLMARAEDLPALSLRSPDAQEAAEKAVLLAAQAAGDERLLRELTLDYTQLYCGCRKDAPYPYESVYGGEGRLLMQPVRDEVVQAYDAAGFDAAAVCATEPEDHLGIELAFAACLMERADAAALRAFASAHGKWIARFSQETGEQARGDFYPAAACVVDAIMGEVLAEMPVR